MSKKEQMCKALLAFISQRSGIDIRNYVTSYSQDERGRDAFNQDYRPMLRHGKHARMMLRAVELRESITADQLKAATRAYSGRLQFVERNGAIGVDYCTGQYFPTEYRKAACAVLAQCLWDYWQPDYQTGDEIRKQAVREFGPAITKTWFN